MQFLDEMSFRQVSVNFELYSLKNGSWKNITSVAPDLELAWCTSPVAFVNGFIHYVGFQRIKSVDPGAERFNNSILAFDVKNEIFYQVLLPKALAGAHSFGLSIWKYKETSIAIVDDNSLGSELRVWVMKEYGLESSWTKLLIVNESSCRRTRLSGLAACRNNGELVLKTIVQTSDENYVGGIVSYDTETHKHRDLRFWWKEYTKCICSYTESLVLLDIGS
uniref:F-box associated beta-propeller type 1 domain-containing protein n=1 Tax=Rhizophora mucronata TaxID=61149 RepID=A0A2P2IL21_RHIMU